MLGWFKQSIARRLAAAAALTTAALVAICQIAAAERWASNLTLLAVLVAIVAAGVWFAVRELLEKPLSVLTSSIAGARDRNFLTRCHEDRSDEIGQLARAYNAMLAEITDLNVSVIDTSRLVAAQQRELALMEELAEKERVLSEANRQMEQRLRELSLLFDITRTINSTLELPEVLRSICNRVGEALGFEECAILLVEDGDRAATPGDDARRLVVRATFGFPASESILGTSFSLGEGISGIVAQSGEWLLIPDMTADTRYLHYQGRHLVDGSFVCMPMKLQDRLVGLFNVLRPRTDAFTQGDIRLLLSLANYAALAIANAQLHGRIKELSLTDELTRLANRRQLIARAELELARAERFDHDVACLMIDIDHFKQFNDVAGHLRGDHVLRDVGRLLQGEVRTIDLVARYGGEEFVALLPRVTPQDALAVAEKLRCAVENAGLPGGITISVGVASYPVDARTPLALLDACDRALFAAKRAGRNRVCAAIGLDAAPAPAVQ
jgi:diguanylate cyclase (GGDEF)-like protein